jgi:transcriptional regulator with XRE-family HTH domain
MRKSSGLINLLRTLARILGITNREIEKKLGLSLSYLSRLYSGGVELKAEHLVQIPRAMGLEPAEFLPSGLPAATHRAQPRRRAAPRSGPGPDPAV